MKVHLMVASMVPAAALAATPTVSDVEIVQHGSRTVQVNYTLSEDAVVTVDFLTNATADVWASIGGKNVTHVWGDANRLVKGAGVHTLYWAPEKSWKTQFAGEYSVKANVKAWATNAPPDYMVVDLCAANTVRYYESADYLPDGDVTNDIYKTDYLVLRKIPAKGVTWRMGSPTGEIGKSKSEGDYNCIETPHYVTLTEDFYLGVFELTRHQCIDRIGVGSYDAPKLADDPLRPVCGDTSGHLSYQDIRGLGKTWPTDGHELSSGCVLDLLRKRTGVAFDLPTEAQWEFACRAGTGSALHNGKELSAITGDNESLDDIAWYDGNSGGACHVVGQLRPNAFGLYDMLGNAREFCLDQIDTSGRGVEVDGPITTDPKGPSLGVAFRVARGGSYDGGAYLSRSATRLNWGYLGLQSPSSGYRVWAPAEAR